MSAATRELTLKLKGTVDEGIDASSLTPTRLAPLKQAEIRRLRISTDYGSARLGEVFDVSGRPGERLALSGVRGLLRRIGAALEGGRLHVSGAAGDEAGREMSGGELIIRGSVGDYTGSAMRGGLIRVSGAAGDHLGGAAPDAAHGMRGGVIVVNGDAGDLVGNRMRRGTIIVAGDIGAYGGARMVAGTIVVGGAVGADLGFNMRRGTIALGGAEFECPPNFRASGRLDSVFVALLARHVKELSRPAARLFGTRSAGGMLYRGDTANGGLGEVLVFG